MNDLEITGLTHSYGRDARALDGVGFAVPRGSIVGLLGPNGSGKSTLIKNVFDLLRPQAGTITIDGSPHAAPDAKRKAVYLSSNDYLPEFLTAAEYAAMIARFYGLEVDREEALELFSRFGMDGRYDDLVEDYSHGMRKKTQLMVALMVRRRLTVIDETLNGVDLEALHLAEKELAGLRDEGLSVLLCTHDFPVLERLADEVVFLDRGRVVYNAPTADLVAEHGSLERMVYGYLESGER
ncbi:ABC-2 type transport system ATP-binding protein [Glycomyces sambucus]|uniref:ABC-2 type transport system ATP-binding protein n=1 Tax=Glycomyces sambucus TaxID=380244 RepID=A0A1G9I7Z7_9ACTN|nr:ABC transporter ATP-binding protein [Glycomyces sambucus]SDL21400.1 ABC-2 type transport system ATP-binding protein [Glycomyces sambucus]